MACAAMLVRRHACAAWALVRPGTFNSGNFQEVTNAAANSCNAYVRGTAIPSWNKQRIVSQLSSKVSRGDLQHEIDGLHQQSFTLGLGDAQQLWERVIHKHQKLSPYPSTNGQLQVRLQTLYNTTQANTEQQQQAILKQLYHVPQLLNYQPDSLVDKAAQLQAALLALDVPRSVVQQLMIVQPAVLTFRPDSLVSKLTEWSQALDKPVQSIICSLWSRQRTTINMAPHTIRLRLKQLADIVGVSVEEMPQLVISHPGVLVSCIDTIQKRVDAVKECLHWPPQQLGQALLGNGVVLTCKVDTLKRKWDIVNEYAAIHPASLRQVNKQRDKAAILNVFTRRQKNFSLLLCIKSKHIQQQRKRRRQQLAASSVVGDKPGSVAELQPHHEMPLVMSVLNLSGARFEAFVVERYPEFGKFLLAG